jgi:lysophospholipase L1-like esterase
MSPARHRQPPFNAGGKHIATVPRHSASDLPESWRVGMARSLWESILWFLIVGLGWLWARHRGSRDVATLTAMASVLGTAFLVIVVPDGERLHSVICLAGLLMINLGARCLTASRERRLVAIARRGPAKAALACLMASLVPLALAERACRVLTEIQALNFHKPLQTVWRAGHDDWRLAMITGDENREPDPVLLWRPVDRKPFTPQRFKGPLAQVPKPPDVFRVMCYGDSLTDGPPKGGWPTQLHRLLAEHPPAPGRRYEVLNAGVAGYSSHQGLMRFLQEVDRYDPNLLLVSFGWNDAAESSGQPDKAYRIPPWPMVALQRTLVRYRAYLVSMYLLNRRRAEPVAADAGPGQPRVSIDDYLANLERFRTEARSRGVPVVFLTRPHKIPPGELCKNRTWRRSVPRYNAALIEWARRQNVLVLDIQRIFERLPPGLFSDECHLTPQGYELMAKLVRDHLVGSEDRLTGRAWLDLPAKEGDGLSAPGQRRSSEAGLSVAGR